MPCSGPSWCRHLIRFHGVLAPNAKLRGLVVPQGPDVGTEAAKPAACEANCGTTGRRGCERPDGRDPSPFPIAVQAARLPGLRG